MEITLVKPSRITIEFPKNSAGDLTVMNPNCSVPSEILFHPERAVQGAYHKAPSVHRSNKKPYQTPTNY